MRILITGTAGFIGFHLAKTLLESGMYVHGYDGMTDYYDVNLKHERHKILESFPKFSKTIGMLEEKDSLNESGKSFNPDIIIHLAAQAGVRYSIENPKSYVDSNLVGFTNLLEMCRNTKIEHLIFASSSSVYGMNSKQPFSTNDNTDHPISLYAATKKSNELLAFSYSHLFSIPMTGLRFFTVYGPYGRPDMAYYKFTKSIDEGRAIDVYNNGIMKRDFTYIDDLVEAILKLEKNPPEPVNKRRKSFVNDSLSSVAPWRVVNIGNSKPIDLMDYIKALENALGIKAEKNLIEMQPGDVEATWANSDLLYQLTDFKPTIDVKHGVEKFVDWYLKYYNK